MSDTVSSPCIDVCTLDASGRICRGCRRTIEEIAAWASMTDAERARIMAALPQRIVPGGIDEDRQKNG